jgi:hypothetical protein
MINQVISRDTRNPGSESSRFGPIRLKRAIHLQEDLLGEILGLFESAGKAVGEIVNALVMLADDLFPGIAIPLKAFRQQFRVVGQFS